jgi:thiamine-monophosphate kinase
LADDAATFGAPLLGGDTVRTPGPLTLSITAFGAVPGARIPRRGGARPGDRLYVSGSIGDAALGLLVRLGRDGGFRAALPEDDRQHLVDRYRLPQPRLALASAILAHASAAMDVSDGLAGDLAKLLAASAAGAVVDLEAVPLSAAAARAVAAEPALFRSVVTGGDDYEILAAIPPDGAAAFETAAAAAGVMATAIGTVTDGRGPVFRWRDGSLASFGAGGFSHF